MDILQSKFDKILSLGYNCFFKLSMSNQCIFQETQLFDYIGTSMWGINQLIKNEYEGLLKPENYKQIKIDTIMPHQIVTNIQYYMRFPHDLKNIDTKSLKDELSKCNQNTMINGLKSVQSKFIQTRKKELAQQIDTINSNFNKFIEKYERRILRFQETLQQNKNILFVRFEEPMEYRIIYGEYADYYKTSEYSYVCDFADLIKLKYPELPFTILYLSKKLSNSFNSEKRIITLKVEDRRANEKQHEFLLFAINSHSEYLISILQ